MCDQVTSICKSASYSLWRIGRIRHLLDRKTTEKLIHSFVSSRLDYCNGLLYGIQEFQMKKLQAIQNSAARIVSRIKKDDQVTNILANLHWLPIKFRIPFKLLCIVFKCIHCEDAPVYLKDLLVIKKQGKYHLRSDNSVTLQTVSLKTLKSYGDRSFTVCGPHLWNALPVVIRCSENFDTFKNRLKTHFYKLSYDS